MASNIIQNYYLYLIVSHMRYRWRSTKIDLLMLCRWRSNWI